ncbi:MAG: TIGR03668 family PPOX class F420-dependent oxidoreductase, partial [Streptosporangiaceae bacterium]
LDNIRRNPAVALLADHYAEDWSALWWARADGQASVIDDPALMAGPARLLAGRYPQYATVPLPGPVIAIQVTRWSGWAAGPG